MALSVCTDRCDFLQFFKRSQFFANKLLNKPKIENDILSFSHSYLWSFVARFTEFPPSKLFSLYRTACRKREERRKEVQRMKSNYTSTLHEIGKHAPPDRLELEEARKRALGNLSQLFNCKLILAR